MPIEIRELIIRTEVRTNMGAHNPLIEEDDLSNLKDDILTACKRMILEKTKKNQFKR
jgi:hypothetical protein